MSQTVRNDGIGAGNYYDTYIYMHLFRQLVVRPLPDLVNSLANVALTIEKGQERLKVHTPEYVVRVPSCM